MLNFVSKVKFSVEIRVKINLILLIRNWFPKVDKYNFKNFTVPPGADLGRGWWVRSQPPKWQKLGRKKPKNGKDWKDSCY